MSKVLIKMDLIGLLLSGGLLSFFIMKVSNVSWIYAACISSILVLLIFSFLPAFKPIRDVFPDGFTVITTIMATLIGVYLAFALVKADNLKNEQIKQAAEIEKDKNNKIEVARKLQADALKVKGDLEAFYDRYYTFLHGDDKKLQELTTNKGLDVSISPPRYLTNYLSQDYGLILLHEKLIPMLSRATEDLTGMTRILKEQKFDSFKNLKDVISLGILYSTYIKRLLDIQIEYLDGKINDSEVDHKRRVLSFTHFRSFTENPNNTIKSIRILPEDRQFPMEKKLTDSSLKDLGNTVAEMIRNEKLKNAEIYLEHFDGGDSSILPQLDTFLKDKGYKVFLTGKVAPKTPFEQGIHFSVEHGHLVIRVGLVTFNPIAP